MGERTKKAAKVCTLGFQRYNICYTEGGAYGNASRGLDKFDHRGPLVERDYALIRGVYTTKRTRHSEGILREGEYANRAEIPTEVRGSRPLKIYPISAYMHPQDLSHPCPCIFRLCVYLSCKLTQPTRSVITQPPIIRCLPTFDHNLGLTGWSR